MQWASNWLSLIGGIWRYYLLLYLLVALVLLFQGISYLSLVNTLYTFWHNSGIVLSGSPPNSAANFYLVKINETLIGYTGTFSFTYDWLQGVLMLPSRHMYPCPRLLSNPRLNSKLPSWNHVIAPIDFRRTTSSSKINILFSSSDCVLIHWHRPRSTYHSKASYRIVTWLCNLHVLLRTRIPLDFDNLGLDCGLFGSGNGERLASYKQTMSAHGSRTVYSNLFVDNLCFEFTCFCASSGFGLPRDTS